MAKNTVDSHLYHSMCLTSDSTPQTGTEIFHDPNNEVHSTCTIFFNIIQKIIPSLLRAYLEYYQSHRTHLSITLSLQYKLKTEWL